MKNHNINNNRSGRILGGLILLAIGVIFLLRNLGIYIPHWVINWPVLLIIIGLYVGFKHKFKGGGWLVMILVGGYFTMEDMADFDFSKYYFATAFIVLGLYLILKPKQNIPYRAHRDKWKKEPFAEPFSGKSKFDETIMSIPLTNRDEYAHDSFIADKKQLYSNENDIIDSVNVFGATHQKIFSKNFKGGDVTAIFGGCELNLTQADFEDTITIEIVAIFGGAKIIIPPTWEVKAELTAILGGIDDKRAVAPFEDGPRKILVIRGVALFGGVDIRNF